MQEEVTQKTVTFCIRTTKITADLLKKVLAAYLRHVVVKHFCNTYG